MKMTGIKRAIMSLMALAMIATTILVGNVVARADDWRELTEISTGGLYADQTSKEYVFESKKRGTAWIYFYLEEPVDTTVTIYKNDQKLRSVSVKAAKREEWTPYEEKGAVRYFSVVYVELVPDAVYKYTLSFGQDTEYWTKVRLLQQAALNKQNMQITAGFSDQLKVSHGKVKRWKSSKPAVAKVDKNGRVTGKKTGKATITAILKDGKQLTCRVIVKSNKFTAAPMKVSDAAHGKANLQIYSAYYDRMGNLVMTVRVVNNSSINYNSIKAIRISLVDEKGRKIASYRGDQNVSVSAYSTKDFVVSVSRSALNKKKADLFTAKVSECSGVGSYTRYY